MVHHNLRPAEDNTEVGPNRVCSSGQPLVNVTLKALLFRGIRDVVFMTPDSCRVQWLKGRALDSRRQKPGFESCAAVLKPCAGFFILHCSS